MVGTSLWGPGAGWQKFLSILLMVGGAITISQLINSLTAEKKL